MGRALVLTLRGALVFAGVGLATVLVTSFLGGWDAYVWRTVGALVAAMAALVVVGALLVRRVRDAPVPRDTLAPAAGAALLLGLYLAYVVVAAREGLGAVHVAAAGAVIALSLAAVGASLPALRA